MYMRTAAVFTQHSSHTKNTHTKHTHTFRGMAKKKRGCRGKGPILESMDIIKIIGCDADSIITDTEEEERVAARFIPAPHSSYYMYGYSNDGCTEKHEQRQPHEIHGSRDARTTCTRTLRTWAIWHMQRNRIMPFTFSTHTDTLIETENESIRLKLLSQACM
jgi:hypothetical protein